MLIQLPGIMSDAELDSTEADYEGSEAEDSVNEEDDEIPQVETLGTVSYTHLRAHET